MRARLLLTVAAPLVAAGVATLVVLPRVAGRAPTDVARTGAVVPSGAPAASTAPARASAAFAGPELLNAAAYVPAQCYAKTREEQSTRTHDGCFVCHQDSREPNYVADADVQSRLSFARYATQNRWRNTLAPPPPAEIPDGELLEWIRTSNYLGPDGELTLSRALTHPPQSWDADHDGAWGGFVPDCYFRVDASGFDVAPSGETTGWRAFASMPVPGMFMPTNGSAGDAFIRLPAPYRRDSNGRSDAFVYRLNLAIVEAYVTHADVPIEVTDERKLGSDLDGDGVLGSARRVAFVWPPHDGRPFHYVGEAAGLDPVKDGWPVAGLFPRGTEFLHSLRYLDVTGGEVQAAARMKELRYMRKTRWSNYGQLDEAAKAEAREKFKSPDALKQVFASPERGVTNGTGWILQGFIEDARGALRPQNVEETTACIGCHGGVGATTDATFSFARKLPARPSNDGWFHARLKDFEGLADPKRADQTGEYAHWLALVGGGDDLLSNDEVRQKFFLADGTLSPAMSGRLSHDVAALLVPSAERALALDRAYLALVRAQRFEWGRDAIVGTPQIHDAVEQDSETGIETPVFPGWKRPERVAGR
jgi:hypothetical protein